MAVAAEQGRLSGRLRFGLRLVVAVAILALILHRVGFPPEGIRFDGRTLTGLGIAALLQLAGQVVAALRWKVVLGPGSPRWGYLARLYLIGGFFSLFLPTSVGGDAVRAAAAASATGRPGGVVASVLLDRGLGVVALALYALIGLALAPEIASRLVSAASLRGPGPAIWIGVPAAIIVVIGCLVLARRSPRLRGALVDAWAASVDLFRNPHALLTAFGLAMLVQGLYLLLWLVLAVTIQLPIPPVTLLLAVPIVSAATMLPITLSGLGVREGAWLLLLSGSGLSTGQIVSFSLLFFAATVVAGVIGGVLFLVQGLKQ